MRLNLKISPSNLGQYFELNCDRYLVYNSVLDQDYIRLGWTPPEPPKNTPALVAGRKWEKTLLNRLEGNDQCKVIRGRKNKKKHENKRNNEEDKDVVDILKRLDSTDEPIYIYQARLKVTASFENQYLKNVVVGEAGISLTDTMRPDFIKAVYSPSINKYCLTVIDAKNAGELKINAVVQIALYSKVLAGVIADENITNCYVDDIGIVWNREKVTDKCIEHDFELKEADGKISDFFSKKALDICALIDLSASGDELQAKLDYCMTQKCEYCGNYDRCKEQSKGERNIKLMPYITPQAQLRVKELVDEGKLEDSSFEAIKKSLEANPDELTENCRYWNDVKNNIDSYEKGITDYYDGRMQRYAKNASSITMPVNQDFALLLTAQRDVDTGRVYAYSWLLKPGKGIDIWEQGFNEAGYVQISEGSGKGTYYDSLIAENDTADEFDNIDRLFVEKIYCLLEKISDYQDKSKRKLQCYVMDEYERENIEEALYYMLENTNSDDEQSFLDKVITILFLFQGERIVTDTDKQPEEYVENPVTVITSEISHLYVLSAGMSYNLQTIASVFSPKYNFDNEKGIYFGKLRNILKDEPIYAAWNVEDREKSGQIIEYIGHHLRKRLFVEYLILTAVQHDNGKLISISSWPKQYQMHKPQYVDYPDVARMDFENRYEQLLKYKSIRSVRISGIDNAIDNGQILWLEYTGKGSTYSILNKEKYVGKEWFTAWLCEDTPENRTQIMVLRDTDYTSNPKTRFAAEYKARSAETVFYPLGAAGKYNFNDNGKTATVDFIPNKKAKFEPTQGKKYLLFEVYSDLNSGKAAECIGKLKDRKDLLDPQMLSGETEISYSSEVEKQCKKFWSPDGCAFSNSQKEAFVHLIEQKLTVLVGPPASGKTDFISRALITIASYYKVEKSKRLKIMVSANSHSAIENVLLKLDKMLRMDNACGIRLYKAGRIEDKKAFEGKSIKLIDDRTVSSTMNENEIQIIGMTCWSAYNAFHSPKTGQMREFDLIVIDEASQLRTIDAFIDLECSSNDTRFLIVGDEDQLPPIILGDYKEKEGEKYIFGSIFHMFLSGLGKSHKDIVRLTDNFRMNNILCKYPAIKLYGEKYKAHNDRIGNQRIRLRSKKDEDIIDFILDPQYPLVLCEISGNTRKQNKAEVKMVTELIHSLWNRLENKSTGRLSSEEGNFWNEHNGIEGTCGIISPHHEHICRLRSSISENLGVNRGEIYVGTVDKLQGKERDVVIVSYGVSDIEKITEEADFIYSSNRFNVSMTRGKAKTIVLLSDAIAEPSLSTNTLVANDHKLKKGVDYIHGYVDYIRQENANESMVHEQCDNYYEDVVLSIWKKKLANDNGYEEDIKVEVPEEKSNTWKDYHDVAYYEQYAGGDLWDLNH